MFEGRTGMIKEFAIRRLAVAPSHMSFSTKCSEHDDQPAFQCQSRKAPPMTTNIHMLTLGNRYPNSKRIRFFLIVLCDTLETLDSELDSRLNKNLLLTLES